MTAKAVEGKQIYIVSYLVISSKRQEETKRPTSLFVVLFFLVELALLFGSGVLVLLVLGHEIVHVGLGLSELHLVHTLASVPVKEGLAAEHSSELLTDALEELLDGGAVTNKGSRHLEATWWDVTHSSLDVVGDPFNKVGAVLVLNVEHLLVNFLHGHATTEDGGNGEVASVTWVTGGHHVLGVKHLLCELGNCEGAVLLGATACEWGETWHEEMETWEWHHVHGELTEISIELTWEAEAGGHTAHAGRHEVVKVTVCWGGELQGAEADIIKGFVINAECLVGILNKLVHGEGGVVGLNNGVRHLW
eukprot:m.143826 g.143826  ORF g.143826 m.143826 type:complete len:306 (-) comp13216_c0_seq1:587-1504(-)